MYKLEDMTTFLVGKRVVLVLLIIVGSVFIVWSVFQLRKTFPVRTQLCPRVCDCSAAPECRLESKEAVYISNIWSDGIAFPCVEPLRLACGFVKSVDPAEFP